VPVFRPIGRLNSGIGEAVILKVYIIIIIDTVDAYHGVAPVEQTFGEMETDKAGGAGY
jgi:hypothetical protein